jgi:hypothetical protein
MSTQEHVEDHVVLHSKGSRRSFLKSAPDLFVHLLTGIHLRLGKVMSWDPVQLKVES